MENRAAFQLNSVAFFESHKNVYLQTIAEKQSYKDNKNNERISKFVGLWSANVESYGSKKTSHIYPSLENLSLQSEEFKIRVALQTQGQSKGRFGFVALPF